ncbi:Uncharacterised protein [Helicobacter pametensis]|nr:DUF6678 family protein [Eikenella sp. NML03-A-027]VDG99955.1 Uncharacterised protein [Helicobacter pametensis]
MPTDEWAELKSKQERYRRRVREFVQQNRLVGAMNNTKWRELREAMDEWKMRRPMKSSICLTKYRKRRLSKP